MALPFIDGDLLEAVERAGGDDDVLLGGTGKVEGNEDLDFTDKEEEFDARGRGDDGDDEGENVDVFVVDVDVFVVDVDVFFGILLRISGFVDEFRGDETDAVFAVVAVELLDELCVLELFKETVSFVMSILLDRML